MEKRGTVIKRGPAARKLKPQREARRQRQRQIDRSEQEENRRRAIAGGQPNELGITQGQNGEQGNIIDPRHAQAIRGSSH